MRVHSAQASNAGRRRRTLLPLLLGAAFVLTLALAPRADAFVYWSSWGSLPTDPDTIGRANLNGTGQNPNFIVGDPDSAPRGLSLSSNRIYWANQDTDFLGRANLNGAPESVDQEFVDVSFPIGTAVNNTHLFWTQASPFAIGRANIDGTAPDPAFIAGTSNPLGIAVNATHIYWVNNGNAMIGRAPIGDPTSTEFFSTGAGSNPQSLALDATHVYWTDTNGTISRAALNGANLQSPWISGASDPIDVAVHAGKIYWAEQGIDTIGRADIGAQNPANVDHDFISGANVVSPHGIAVNDLSVPACQSTEASTGQDDAVGIDLKCTGGSLTHSIAAHPLHGTLSGLEPSAGAVTYTPDPGFTGADSFAYAASNPGSVDSSTATATITVEPTPPTPPEPSNDFEIGKPKKNKKKGTAELPINDVPGAGQLDLSGAKVKDAFTGVLEAGDFTLPVKAKGKAKKKLKKKGKAKVKVDVTFTPEGGDPATQSAKVKLKKKH
jgi:hypothetical protein